MKIDPRMFVQFAAIAEEESFTKASERLHVAQPWLSARMRKLEEQLGFALLSRNTRNVTLTQRGKEFLPAAQAVAASVQAAEALVLQLRRLQTSRLRIGVPPYSSSIRQRRELTERFAATHREVSVELDIGWSLSLLEGVRSGDLDMAFVIGHFDEQYFDSIGLGQIGLALVMSRHNPLASQSVVPVQQVANTRIDVFTRGLNPRLFDELYNPLIQAGAQLVQVAEISDRLPDHLESIDALSAFFWFDGEDGQEGEVVSRRVDTPATVRFSLVCRRGAVTAVSRAFWSMASQPGRGSSA